MPWGDHKGTLMGQVPGEYLLWLFQQKWIKEWPALHTYLVDNQNAFIMETEEDSRVEGFESLEDYMRFGRD